MTNRDMEFDEWFELLCDLLLDEHGVRFSDPDAVKEDYDNGKNLHYVKDEIAAEYAA